MRDNSPPEATRARGRSGWPGLALTSNSMSSMPYSLIGGGSVISMRVLNTPPAIPSTCIRPVTFASRRCAAPSREDESSRAAAW